MENLSTYFILFIIYSFLGWVVEVINCSIVEKKVVNRGFLISPICPIYGCGAILITLVLSNYKDDWFVVFCMAVILCGLLEYFTSWIMEKLFHARWWDYSHNKFNINGRVCLETMIPFGILGLVIIYVLNPLFYNLLSYIPSNVSNIISLLLFILLIADMIISCNVISKVTSTVKNVAAQNKKDDTYEITAKAREILKTNWKGKRLLDAFPDLETIKEKVKKVANLKRLSPKIKIIIAISTIAVIILTLALTIAIINDMKRQKYVAYNGENLAEEKYSGYKDLIDELKSKHPNWNFILFYTKLDWNEVITNEGHSDMRTNPLNLIPDYMEYPENWVCEIDKDKTFDNGHWLCASNIAIAHQMDPRNILTEEIITL